MNKYMNTNITTTTTITLELTPEEAFILKRMFQNPITDTCPEQNKLRKTIFSTLPTFEKLEYLKNL